MIVRRSTLTMLVSLCALTGLLALASGPAQALVTHQYIPGISAQLSEEVPVEGPHGEAIPLAGPLTFVPASMTIDSGHLWIVERSQDFINYRVDEYDASTGAFLAQPIHVEAPTRFSGPNILNAGIAVSHAGGKAELYLGESLGQAETPAVAVYSESGTLEQTWTGAATPAKTFAFESEAGVRDVVADNSTDPLDQGKGYVYVADRGPGGRGGSIDVFRPEADGEEHFVTQITGPTSGKAFENLSSLAVSQVNGDLIAQDGDTLDILEPGPLGEYSLVDKISSTPRGPLENTYAVTVDGGNGEIYVTEGFNPVVVDEFSSTGAYIGATNGEDTPDGLIHDVYTLAADPESHDLYVADNNGVIGLMRVFGPDIVKPDVTTGPAGSVRPTSATLTGTVNPLEAGAATCRFEWGTSKAFGKVAPCEPEAVANGGSPVPVHVALSGLQPDVAYYYRLQAGNANGTNVGEASQDQEFTTPGPAIHDESVTNLASTSVTFDATIDPHGAPTTYYFQYGTSTGYGSEVPAAPGEAIGSGEGDVVVTPHHVQGLSADTLYHFRVVVVSEPQSGEFEVFDGQDATFVTQAAAESELPDGRHWEMVSPPNKSGARIFPISETGVIQVANSGDGISYQTDNPIEAESQGFSNSVQDLSTRGPAGWQSRVISLPHSGSTGAAVGIGGEYWQFADDLGHAVVEPFGSFLPGLSPEASEPTPLVRSLDPSCAVSCSRPLVTSKPGYANVPAETVFGGQVEGRCAPLFCGPEFVGATADLSHIVLTSKVALKAGAGSEQLYEWSNGELSLVSVLPNGTAALGPELGATRSGDFRGAISSDGSRVIWTDALGVLELRDLTLGKTVQLDTAESSCVAENKCRSGGGQFQLASADGSKVFFTDVNPLTKQSSESDLYECEMVVSGGQLECKLSDLAKSAVGVLGASEDGSYLYFVASSVLAQGAVAGEDNLYLSHDGVTKLVAVLSSEDRTDWSNALGQQPVRVSQDGKWVEFMSARSLTGYDNLDAVSGRPDAEVYLYDASTGHLACASCDPTGARPLGAEYRKLEEGLVGGPRETWEQHGWVAANVPGWVQYSLKGTAAQPRYLSGSGRLFFNSGDALVPQDVDGTQDVYEYEPPGVGDCTTASTTFNERSGGCVALISAGTSATESAFLGASESGSDVFLLTSSKLLPQDYDKSDDIYDAHECSDASPCFPVAVPQPPACTNAEACRAAPTPQPASFGAPSSATFTGAGNIAAGSGGTVTTKTKAKSLTRAQKLANALKVCREKPKKRRAACVRRARARFGSGKSGEASKKKGNR